MKEGIVKIGWVEYKVLHNLDDFGFDFDKAVKGFFLSRHKIDVDNFCKYIRNSGAGGLICFRHYGKRL